MGGLFDILPPGMVKFVEPVAIFAKAGATISSPLEIIMGIFLIGNDQVPSFHPSYRTSVHQSYFKCNSVADKPLQTLVRHPEIQTAMYISIHCSILRILPVKLVRNFITTLIVNNALGLGRFHFLFHALTSLQSCFPTIASSVPVGVLLGNI